MAGATDRGAIPGETEGDTMTAKMGAPPKAPEERLVPGSVRATQALWDLFHGVADARGIERSKAMREAMRGWIENGVNGGK